MIAYSQEKEFDGITKVTTISAVTATMGIFDAIGETELLATIALKKKVIEAFDEIINLKRQEI